MDGWIWSGFNVELIERSLNRLEGLWIYCQMEGQIYGLIGNVWMDRWIAR